MAKSRTKGKGFTLGGGGGGPNMPGGARGGLAGQLQSLQQQMLETQEALGDKTVEVSSGGGMVSVVMSGHKKLVSIKIDPQVVDPEDVDMLQDLIVAAVNEAVEASEKLAADEMSAFTGGLGLNLPGLF
jgi:DNA-binding YbaB/EbfC family protein